MGEHVHQNLGCQMCIREIADLRARLEDGRAAADKAVDHAAGLAITAKALMLERDALEGALRAVAVDLEEDGATYLHPAVVRQVHAALNPPSVGQP